MGAALVVGRQGYSTHRLLYVAIMSAFEANESPYDSMAPPVGKAWSGCGGHLVR